MYIQKLVGVHCTDDTRDVMLCLDDDEAMVCSCYASAQCVLFLFVQSFTENEYVGDIIIPTDFYVFLVDSGITIKIFEQGGMLIATVSGSLEFCN